MTTSPTAGGASRSWTSIDDFVWEVSEARICDGVHYRTCTEVGVAMGKRVGELAVAKVLRARDQRGSRILAFRGPAVSRVALDDEHGSSGPRRALARSGTSAR